MQNYILLTTTLYTLNKEDVSEEFDILNLLNLFRLLADSKPKCSVGAMKMNLQI
jgi:hypothetical protein